MTWKTLDSLVECLNEDDKMVITPDSDTDIPDVVIIHADGSQTAVVRGLDGWRFHDAGSYSDVVRD
jgi:hypothetical protein